jgi:hypothetical protein
MNTAEKQLSYDELYSEYLKLSGGTQSVPRGGTSKCTINKREK